MIDQATAQRIKDTADIVEVVSDYVHLIRRGANYMGLCPFHNERTPSFSVSRKRNFCYCFSCKKGGSPVNFIMEKEGLSYQEALMHLAKKYGIEVKERELTDEERQRQSEREGMLVANEWAMNLMEHDLLHTDEGRDVGLSYFTQRGVTDEAIKAFHLGYALDSGSHLVTEARTKGFNIDTLKTLGLVGTSGRGTDYDRFRGRVIFPILNNSGKVIAFGGRDLKGGLAKYINSPESMLYKKSNELYGIFQARAAIVRESKCFLVEGYMDVIGMWQSGMKNVVASSGTALTDGQIALIHRLTDNITLIYDGDAAGIKASLRGIDMLLSHKLNVKVLLLPDGDDPDSFARKHTPEEFRKYVEENETDIIRFKISVLLTPETASDPQKRIEAVNSVVESIAHIPDPVARDVYIQQCAKLLGVTEESIAISVGRAREILIDKWRKEREWKRLRGDESLPDAPVADPQRPSIGRTIAEMSPAKPKRSEPDTSFRPLERPLITYCLKYAYKEVFQTMDEDDDSLMNVLEYVESELSADDIHFSIPEYATIFQELKKSKPQFDEALFRKRADIDREKDQRRRDAINEIADGDFSVSEIAAKEQKMEKDLDDWSTTQINDFIKEWPSRMLASHENDMVRRAVTELLREKHHLSNIFANMPQDELEENRLDALVPRAITEWKSEILNRQLRDLLQKFHDTGADISPEDELQMQLRLNSIMNLRSLFAKETGERVLSASKINN